MMGSTKQYKSKMLANCAKEERIRAEWFKVQFHIRNLKGFVSSLRHCSIALHISHSSCS